MVIALIVSGGKGVRMGSEIPKQFLELSGIPILQRTIAVFDSIAEVDQIVLVLPEAYFTYFESIGYHPEKPISIVPAGIERQDSVRNGLMKANEIDPESIVLIHDGVRPLVSEKTIVEGIQYTRKYKAAACGVHPKDTIKEVGEDGFAAGTLDRSRYFLIHTPQCFYTKNILKAHDKLRKIDKFVTDDTMVHEEYCGPVYLYEDDYSNIKITTAEDLMMAEQILRRRNHI
ncbi:MAG TPA: 2-C-methyl-D-erythritol 4-phosphate cytidylyltransferase [Bacteroidales bacterium]|nr:2-C-methyl-D-erythritol 4-phosphate cytidylyltransferase [Bacteroidales bacterium]